MKHIFNCSQRITVLPQSPAASSQKNLTGPPRVARDIVADLYNDIQRWNDSHVKGAQIVKQIGILKSEYPKHYSFQLEEYTCNLYNVVQNLNTYKKNFVNYKTQIRALGQLDKTSEPLFISLDVSSLSGLVEYITDAPKTMVLENIAHSKNKDEAMFFAACWTLQPSITSSTNVKLEALLVETGHRNFN
ncbi:hypothetical protein NQ317_010270 [Molorchus minor]|uniref:Uncharacterized protein n=1 Tax=Molorchus minor TaxID=1323400 RepID=A0ABQ9JEB1_9CUCU|nr:hypothetical protein NQ317_010270 [Molorchus minor]